jgi:hypothetical protein
MASPDAGAWRLIWIEQTGSDINGRQQRNSTFIATHDDMNKFASFLRKIRKCLLNFEKNFCTCFK